MIRLLVEHGARVDEDRQVWSRERMSGPVGELMRSTVQAARERTGAP